MSAPRSDLMTQSLVLPIDVCRGLGISPLRMKHFAVYFSCQADVGPRSRQDLFFPSVCFLQKNRANIRAHSKRCINVTAGIFEISYIRTSTNFLFPIICSHDLKVSVSFILYVGLTWFILSGTADYCCRRTNNTIGTKVICVCFFVPYYVL